MIFDCCFIIICFLISFFIKKITFKYTWPLPISLIAGILGFAVVNFTQFYSFELLPTRYLEIFLAIIFICFPLTVKSIDFKLIKRVQGLWFYSLVQYLFQWGFSIVCVFYIFKTVDHSIEEAISVILPGGFAGGHASAAILGDIFSKLGIDGVLSLSMTMATTGVLLSLIGGYILIFFNKENIVYRTSEIEKIKIPKVSLVPIAQVIVTLLLTLFVEALLFKALEFRIPLFVIALFISFFISITMRQFLQNFSKDYGLTSNVATDLLVFSGLVSVKITYIKEYALVLIFLVILGLSISVINFVYLKKYFFKNETLEKGIFTWGWSLGGLIFGLALVKSITFYEDNQKLLPEFALTYLLISPIELSLLFGMPFLIVQGFAPYLAILLILLAIGVVKYHIYKADK